MNAATFRQDFPEFANTTNFPDSQVTFWLGLALKMLNADSWGEVLDQGIELYAAHNLVLERQARQASSRGAVPGTTNGILSSKAVDKVSASYDTGSASFTDAGHWNLTTYGTRFYYLMRLMNGGGRQF